MSNPRARTIVVSETQIQQRVRVLAEQISVAYQNKELDVVCMVNGASMFCTDLVRHLTVPARLHHLGFSGYPQGNDSGEVRITLDVAEPLHGRHVLAVEGIVVSGRTPRYVLDMLALRRPASLALCALGTKPSKQVAELPIEFVGFEFDSEIVIGYGVGAGVDRTLSCLVEA